MKAQLIGITCYVDYDADAYVRVGKAEDVIERRRPALHTERRRQRHVPFARIREESTRRLGTGTRGGSYLEVTFSIPAGAMYAVHTDVF